MNDTNTTNAVSDESAFTHDLESIIQFEHASGGQRLLNLVIDYLVMYFVLSWGSGFLVGLILNAAAPEFLYSAVIERNTWDLFLFSYMAGILNFLFYYTLCEAAFKGRTLGKLITGTRAIREDGSDLKFKDAILRSLCRIVPLEILSGLGTPWHDSWTKTAVVKTR